MRITKKVLSMILAMVLVLGLLPATALATGTDDVVYLSISFDDEYIQDTQGNYIAYLPVSLADVAAVDLAEYGLDNMLYDADEDGNYETTALQLIIYAHENLYGGDWGDVNFSAVPGSSYFAGGVFGFTDNLMYFHNGDFPVDESQQSDYMTVGATSDRIVLEPGDFLDIASFGCYAFLWDTLGGFHFFADSEENFLHDFEAEAGKPLSLKLMHSFCDLMYGSSYLYGAADYEVFYGKTYGEAEGTVTTDGDGNAEITIEEPGTYYLWCMGGNGSDDGTHGSCDYSLETGEPCIVSAPAYATITVTGEEEPEVPSEPQQPGEAQDVSAVLNATMAKLASTVTAPAFGTNAGEWTVFGLARGGYYAENSQYFADYYDRIVEYVNTTAASVGMDGALDANKSTDNSRLIMALSAIGRDATSVGNWDLVEAYSANGINWIKKQGMNGTIWTLIALDCGNYKTSDSTIRQQCVEAILEAQHDDGGWSLVTAKAQPSNVDITGMTLTALYPYRDQAAVKAACDEAFAWLSESQLDNGGFPYGEGETSESCVWAIVACATWGINPDTDSRFIKNGNSAIDNLLTYYVEDEAMFEHSRGAGSNAMATDQATYGLVAYNRLLKGQPALYDYSDVTPNTSTPDTPDTPNANGGSAALGLPEKINAGASFNGVISIDQWDNEAGYKLIDLIITVPQGVTVTGVTTGNGLAGGDVFYNLEAATGKLRVVYMDLDNYTDLTMTGEELELFTIGFQAGANAASKLDFAISGMSLKKSSDSSDENAMAIVNTSNAKDSVTVVEGISFSAVELYVGDDVDLIPSTKKAVAVAVTGITDGAKLSYDDGTNQIEFLYSEEMTEKTGVTTYVALVNAVLPMGSFVEETNYTIKTDKAETITFGDSDGNGVINAQDALAAVNAWLRVGDELTDTGILTLNVNGDSRINTFDAMGIVEAFVNGTEYGVVTKAATITNKQ